MSTEIEIVELEMDSGEGLLFAWGIHDPSEFVRALRSYGVEEGDVHRVRHERYVMKRRPSKLIDAWYEPVQGEPNATVLLP